MKIIIATALDIVLLLGTLCSSTKNLEHTTVEIDSYTTYSLTEIKGFASDDAKYLIEHPAYPITDELLISEDMSITTIDGIPQVSGTITNISEFDLQDVYIKFYLFSEDELRTPPTPGVPFIYWSLGEQFNAGETVEFLTPATLQDPTPEEKNALKKVDYITLIDVDVDYLIE